MSTRPPTRPLAPRRNRISEANRLANEFGTPNEKELLELHLFSESTGGLARLMVSVAIAQFPSTNYRLHEHPFCTDLTRLGDARKLIPEGSNSIVFSALTQARLKRSLSNWCRRRQIVHWELVDPLVGFIAKQTGHRPVRDATLSHCCDEDYYRRMDAWEFTLQHDDSRRLETAGQADLILLGVSRVGKTPLAAYLGSLGYRVANIALAREAAIPEAIKQHLQKVIGLTIDPERLASIRKRRMEVNRFTQALQRTSHPRRSYTGQKAAFDDVVIAEQRFRQLGIKSLDITDMTVEESASRILNVLGIGKKAE